MTFVVRWRVKLMTGNAITHLATFSPLKTWESGRTLCGREFSPGLDTVDRVRSKAEMPFPDQCQHCAAVVARREERDREHHYTATA